MLQKLLKKQKRLKRKVLNIQENVSGKMEMTQHQNRHSEFAKRIIAVVDCAINEDIDPELALQDYLEQHRLSK